MNIGKDLNKLKNQYREYKMLQESRMLDLSTIRPKHSQVAAKIQIVVMGIDEV